MPMSYQSTQTVPVALEDGTLIYVKVDAPPGRRDVDGGPGPKSSFGKAKGAATTSLESTLEWENP